MDGIVNIPREETQNPAFKGPKKASTLPDLANVCPKKNLVISESIAGTWHIVNNPKYKNILCLISGGINSDILLDMCYRSDLENKIDYMYIDTGIGLHAIDEHLDYLEKKYGVEISRMKIVRNIPMYTMVCGEPFLSRTVSGYMEALQDNGFKWEDEDFDKLCEKYPYCIDALKWWCNENHDKKTENIQDHELLKEFIMEYPPEFKISVGCCERERKYIEKKLFGCEGYDLYIFGKRNKVTNKFDYSYRAPFMRRDNGGNIYNPLFWFKDSDRNLYMKHFGLTSCRCYSEYKLPRTDCIGCPLSSNYEDELQVVRWFEPGVYNKLFKIFGDSYFYYGNYYDFAEMYKYEEKKRKKEEKKKKRQSRMPRII